MNNFSLVDESAFDQLAYPQLTPDTAYNYCPDCNIPMSLCISEYQCMECGLVRAGVDPAKDHDETYTSSIRITTGTNKGRFYNITGEYSKTQKKLILEQLLGNQSSFTGNAIPVNILVAAATVYNTIQKLITEDTVDTDGVVVGQKKFVRRGNIKDEVLAGLIYFECIREKLVRKKKDIATFMKLPTNGFSRGEDILRNLQAEGKLDIPVDEEPIEGFVDRYMESLNLDNPLWSQFVIEICEESERRKIGMNSQISSKVVGAIWNLICKLRLNITAQQLEKAADNTKKNTFTKFYKCIVERPTVFKPIHDRYGITS